MGLLIEPMDVLIDKRGSLGYAHEALNLVRSLGHLRLNDERAEAMVAQGAECIAAIHLCNCCVDPTDALYGDNHIRPGKPGERSLSSSSTGITATPMNTWRTWRKGSSGCLVNRLPRTDGLTYDAPVDPSVRTRHSLTTLSGGQESGRLSPRLDSGLSTSLRVSLLIGALVLVLSVVFGILIAESAERAISAAEGEAFDLLNQVVRHTLADEVRFAGFGIEALVHDPGFNEAVARSDRAALLDRLGPYYASIRDRIPRIHVHTAEGLSLLRLHEPDLYGDDLTESRPMIDRVVREGKAVSGIEIGVHGPGLRTVVPVFHESTYVGSVEFGMDLGLDLLNRLKERYAGEFSMRFLGPDDSIVRHASTRPESLCTTTPESRDRIRLGEPFWVHSCTSALGVAYYPFRSFEGEVIGYIKAEIDRVSLVDDIRAHRRTLFVVGLSLIGLATIIAYASLSVFLRPLRSIVEQTRAIGDRIISGDVNVRGDLDATGSDFRGVIGAVNDIINALRSREVLLQAIIEGIPGIVFYCRPDRTVIWANRRARNHVAGIVGAQVGNPGDPSGFLAQEIDLFDMALSSRCVAHLSTCYPATTAIGSQRSCWEHTAVPILDGETVTNVIRISHDITEKRDAEDQLRTLNQTLEARVAEETARRQEQERVTYQQSRLASIGELAAGMAHEINQPLSSIGFAVQNVVTTAIAAPIDPAYLETKRRLVQEDIERIRRIIDHVRTFARDDREDFAISFRVADAVANALALVGEQIRSHGINLTLGASSPDITACGNPFQYEQVVLNLLSNARFAVEERTRSAGVAYEPRIAMVLESDDTEIRLIVEDNGCGIPSEALARVFDPFFTTKGRGGSGLGLSISFGIVERMGGSIVLTRLDSGTRAIVSVPADRSRCTA